MAADDHPSASTGTFSVPRRVGSRFDREWRAIRGKIPVDLPAVLRSIVGERHVLTLPAAMRPYITGYRIGGGTALAVVVPGSLIEQWRVLQACVAARAIVIVQAANTGLTGGSTPHGTYDRPVIVISTRRLAGVHPIHDGRQVICLPGTTLHHLERVLSPFGREPHSVIGSSCFGATVAGGVCNNSGGALVRRGPAYSELALFARVEADGTLVLVNHLGVRLSGDAEAALVAVERGGFGAEAMDVGGVASDGGYEACVRDVEAATPARFNADPARLCEASGSAGKVMVLAVRLDTFAAQARTTTFHIGTDDAAELTRLRRALLTSPAPLPIAAEYIHRDAFAMAAAYGRDMFLAIRLLGTDRLPALERWRTRLDALAARVPLLPGRPTDRLMHGLAKMWPRHLPRRVAAHGARFAHNLLLKVSEDGRDDAVAALNAGPRLDWYECDAAEAAAAFLHRFVVAAAAVRYRDLHPGAVEDVVALDVALPRNESDWFETLPDELAAPVTHRLYYGHFLCHVFHQDYIVAKGAADPMALEERMVARLQARGAECPAEHNVGHLYHAKPALEAHYRTLDPTNMFNPGIGRLPRDADWS